jgi:hypothetical protein
MKAMKAESLASLPVHPTAREARTNSVAIFALALALLPALATFVTFTYMRSHLWKAFIQSGAGDELLFLSFAAAFTAINLAVIAVWRRPGLLSTTALIVAVLVVFFLLKMPVFGVREW